MCIYYNKCLYKQIIGSFFSEKNDKFENGGLNNKEGKNSHQINGQIQDVKNETTHWNCHLCSYLDVPVPFYSLIEHIETHHKGILSHETCERCGKCFGKSMDHLIYHCINIKCSKNEEIEGKIRCSECPCTFFG